MIIGDKLRYWAKQNWRRIFTHNILSIPDDLSWLRIAFQFKALDLGIMIHDIKLEAGRWFVHTTDYGWEPYSIFADRWDLKLHE